MALLLHSMGGCLGFHPMRRLDVAKSIVFQALRAILEACLVAPVQPAEVRLTQPQQVVPIARSRACMHPAPGAAHTNQRWQQASFSVLSAQPGLFTCMQKQWSGCLLQHAYRTRKHAQPALLPVMSMLPPAACTACGAYLASRPDHCVTKRHRFSCR
eukprot:scaffold205798_cov24-Tisochrysis_lutea.AAC.2